LCIEKTSKWEYYSGQLTTTYKLPVTYKKHFECKDGKMQQSYIKFVKVYGKRYDSSYCYIFNELYNDIAFEVENNNFVITTNNKPKKYTHIHLENKKFPQESDITSLKYTGIQSNHDYRDYANIGVYNGKSYYNPPTYYSSNCVRAGANTLNDNGLMNGDSITISLKHMSIVNYIGIIGSLLPITEFPPLEYETVNSHRYAKAHKGIYVKNNNCIVTWAYGYELYYVICGKTIFIGSFSGNTNEFSEVVNDISSYWSCYTKPVQKIIIKPISYFPQFSIHLTIYGSVKNGDNHNEIGVNKSDVVTYTIEFPRPKKVNKRDRLRGCWDKEYYGGRNYLYKRKKQKHYEIVHCALKDIDI
jgi:hypothetical protein